MEKSLFEKVSEVHEDIISELDNKELLELDRMDFSFFVSSFKDEVNKSDLKDEDFPERLAKNYADMCVRGFGRIPLNEIGDAILLIESIPGISNGEGGWDYEMEKGSIFISRNQLHRAPYFYLADEFEKRYDEVEPYIEELSNS